MAHYILLSSPLHLQMFLLNGLSYYHESENLYSSCHDGVHRGTLTLNKSHLFFPVYLGKDSKRKIPDRIILVWSYTTDLSNAFDSIWHSALFHQVIALDFPHFFVVYKCFF